MATLKLKSEAIVSHLPTVQKDMETAYTVDDAVNKAGFSVFQYILFFFSAVTWIADAMQFTLESLLISLLSCEWEIYTWQIAVLSSMLFLGFIAGGYVLGAISDKYGRKVGVFITELLIILCAVTGSFMPSFYWLLPLRCMTGFALAGSVQVVALCAEYSPTKVQGKASFILCYFWGIGVVLGVLLAWVILRSTHNWRLYYALCGIPALTVALGIWWLPESARFYIVQGRMKSADKIISKMAQMNGKSLPHGKLQSISDAGEQGRFKDLFVKKFRLSTVLFWFIMASVSFCYYGTMFITPIIVKFGNIYYGTLNGAETNISETSDGILPCVVMTDKNFIDLTWQSTAELLRVFFVSIIIEKIDRKKIFPSISIISSAMFFLLILQKPYAVILICNFIARALVSTLYILVFIMVSETFPTTLRSLALGTTVAGSGIGGILMPYVSDVFLPKYPIESVCLYGIVIFLAGVASLLLPIETRGIKLSESHK